MSDSPTPAEVFHQRQLFLSRWLEDFAASETMTTEEFPPDGRSAAELGIPLPDPYSENPPGPGEIRLVAPEKVPECPRPLYLAVLGPWMGADMVLAAPFSVWPIPAVPGELLLTARPPGLLRTLCLWNARSLPLWTLMETWEAGHLQPEELSEARAVFRSQFLGKPLSPSILARTGPPILEGDDPRQSYLKGETAYMGPLQNDALHHVRAQEMLQALNDSSTSLDKIIPALDSDALRNCRKAVEADLSHAASVPVFPAAIFLKSAEELIARIVSKKHIEVMRAQAEEIIPLGAGGEVPSGQWRLVSDAKQAAGKLQGFLLLDGIAPMTIIGRGRVRGNVATLAAGNAARLAQAAQLKIPQFLVFHC